MTTRITLTILLTTWIVLIVGEAGAFYTARLSLLTIFDQNLFTRATSALENGPASAPAGDHLEIRDAEGKAVEAALPDAARLAWAPRGFVTSADGRRLRMIALRGFVKRGEKFVPFDGTYSASADRLDRTLLYLAWMLLLISLACGLTTAWVSLKLSRAALRPLRETADVIAQIDERQLSRRIDAEKMPVELKPMAGRLNEMLERLERVFQQRKQFLADAAHELRTPTAALLTTLEVAARRPRDQSALLEAIHSGVADVQRLRRLVESLMQQARSDVERPSPLANTDVAAMLQECVRTIAPLAGEKNVSIEIDGETPADLHFVTQPDRLRSVVLNLLSNAIEYNRPGGSVSVRGEHADGSTTLKLSIRDTGIGIPPEQLPHVFEPFYRGGAVGDDAQHLGLGLFLVRSHVEALRGQCKVESEAGRGTTMYITLPEPEASVA